MDAVITAAGPMPESLRAAHPHEYKCLLEVAGRTLLDRTLAAARAAQRIDRLCIVGPPDLRPRVELGADDLWVDDQGSGSANTLAGLDALADREQVVFIASDVPFLSAAGLDDLVARAPADRGFVLPVYRRAEIEAKLPQAGNKYVPFREGDLTASSVMVLSPRQIAAQRQRVEMVFDARKNFGRLFAMAGPLTSLRFAAALGLGWRVLSVPQLEATIARLLGLPVAALWGCDPAFNFDLDHDRDWAELEQMLAVNPDLAPREVPA